MAAYTTINDPSAHFQNYSFSKSAGTGSAVFDGNSDLQPDFLWTKSFSNADSHEIWDSTRGVNSTLFSDAQSAEDTAANRITSFDTDGYSWGSAGNHNAAGNMVAWAWKANGGTTSSNTDGTITSTVQANTDAGFSIVEYTTGTVGAGSGGYFTVGHGLGVTPDLIITKRLSGTSGWWTWHTGLSSDTTHYLNITSTAAQASVGDMWGNGHSSTVFGGGAGSHYSSSDYIAYCFASKEGFSKFGKYTGNGNANGPFVYTGFKPAYVVIKSLSSGSAGWFVIDNSRGFNGAIDYNLQLQDNGNQSAETANFHMLGNGFKITTTYANWNTNSHGYTYWAFAENPFVTSTAIPTTGG